MEYTCNGTLTSKGILWILDVLPPGLKIKLLPAVDKLAEVADIGITVCEKQDMIVQLNISLKSKYFFKAKEIFE